MSNSVLLVGAIFLLVYLVATIFLSIEVINWIPDKKDRSRLLLLLWLIPVLGFLLVYRQVRPDLFDKAKGSETNSAVSSGLLALDSIFNPGSAHILDAQKKSEVTIRVEGEMYDRDLPDSIDLNEETGNENNKNMGEGK